MKLTEEREEMEEDCNTAQRKGDNNHPVAAVKSKMAPVSPSTTGYAITDVHAINGTVDDVSVNGFKEGDKRKSFDLPNGKAEIRDIDPSSPLQTNSKPLEDTNDEDEDGLGVEVETYSRASSPGGDVDIQCNDLDSRPTSNLCGKLLSEKCNGDSVPNCALRKNGSSLELDNGLDDLNGSVQSDEFHLRLSDDEMEVDDPSKNAQGEDGNSNHLDDISCNTVSRSKGKLETSTGQNIQETEAQKLTNEVDGDAGPTSRKRTYSNADEQGQDSKKKINGFKDKEVSSNKASEQSDTKASEMAHKRQASEPAAIESKKIRISRDLLKVDDEQVKERERLQNLQDAASMRGVEMSEPLRSPQTNLDLAIERVVAKAATAAAPCQPVDLPFLRKLHKGDLESMSRSDLEELVLQKICEAITERSVVGEMRLRCQALEKGQEKWRDKFNALRKQMHELNVVMKKYMEQQQSIKSADGRPSGPVRITRSVGLQVSLPLSRPVGPAAKARQTPPTPSTPTMPCSPKTPQNVVRQDSSPAVQQPSRVLSNIQPAPRGNPLGPRMLRPVASPAMPPTQLISGPPALVPTSAPSGTMYVTMPVPMGGVAAPRQVVTTTPRAKAPLQQQPAVRPRLNIAPNLVSPTSQAQQIVQIQQASAQNRHTPPQSVNRQAATSSVVEVIDITDKEDQAKNASLRISQQQQQHQQQQAANAAAQNLANNGMTVRVITPSQANPMRGNVKAHFIMKGNQGNLLIPFAQGQGVSVPSSAVVHAVATAQSAHQLQPVQQIFTTATGGSRTNTVATARPQSNVPQQVRTSGHPAPLPPSPIGQQSNPSWRLLPPKPSLKIQHQNNGIVLSWNMALSPAYADIESYQLFAYQEGSAPPSPNLWKKVGDVKALPLPMACTLTQFVEGHRYHFTVRAVDKHGRMGPFSQQGSIRLGA